jgi:fermentation-respiration switch protein FrsA (DUF1100 family)
MSCLSFNPLPFSAVSALEDDLCWMFFADFDIMPGEYWPSEDAIKRISQHTPVLFLTGRLDGLVPPSHMDVLMVNCTSNTKVRMVLSQGDHNDTCVQVSHPSYLNLELC